MPESVKYYKPSEVLGQFWTLANMLSLSRLVLVLPITYIIIKDGSTAWLFGLVALAVATDFFDGRVARWSHTVSEWGKVLDPLADKIGAGLVVLALTLKKTLPVWFVVSMVVRDVLIVWGGIRMSNRTGRVYMSLWSGKVAVSGVSVTVLMALLKADPPVLLACIWITTVLLGYSFLRYLIRYIRVMRMGYVPADSIPLRVVEPEATLPRPEAAGSVHVPDQT